VQRPDVNEVVRKAVLMSSNGEYDRMLDGLIADLAIEPRDPIAIEQVLAGVTNAAVRLIRGVDYADILMIDDGQFRSMSPTAPLAIQLDDVQRRFQQGPCLQAAISHEMVRCTDLRTEPRWPEFSAAAVELGVFSMLSFQLYTHRGGAGALNLFGRAPRERNFEAEALGASLAAHAALAIATLTQRHQFESAVATRDTIGQAKGILMERFQIDAMHAFELLKQLSQNTNTPLRQVAERLIESLNKPPNHE